MDAKGLSGISRCLVVGIVPLLGSLFARSKDMEGWVDGPYHLLRIVLKGILKEETVRVSYGRASVKNEGTAS